MKLTPKDLNLLVSHKGEFRFYSDKPPTASWYKQAQIPMFDAKSFQAIAPIKRSKIEQPTITNSSCCQPTETWDMEVEFEKEWSEDEC